MISLVIKAMAVLRRRRELAKYDDFSVVELLRKQGAKIGEDCRIQIRSLGPEPWLIRIGDHCTISSNVVFNTHDGGVWLFAREHPSLQRFGTIEILDNCFIGIGAILLTNIRIGPNSIVGAGSIVTRDVPPDTIVAGSPARPISRVEDYRKKALALWEKQRPPGYLEDLQDGTFFPAAHIQRRKGESIARLRRHLERLFWDDLRE